MELISTFFALIFYIMTPIVMFSYGPWECFVAVGILALIEGLVLVLASLSDGWIPAALVILTCVSSGMVRVRIFSGDETQKKRKSLPGLPEDEWRARLVRVKSRERDPTWQARRRSLIIAQTGAS